MQYSCVENTRNWLNRLPIIGLPEDYWIPSRIPVHAHVHKVHPIEDLWYIVEPLTNILLFWDHGILYNSFKVIMKPLLYSNAGKSKLRVYKEH